MEKIEIFRKFMKKAKISLQIRVFGPEPALIEIGIHRIAYGVVRESRVGIAEVGSRPRARFLRFAMHRMVHGFGPPWGRRDDGKEGGD